MRARQYKVQQYNDAQFSSITCCTRVSSCVCESYIIIEVHELEIAANLELLGYILRLGLGKEHCINACSFLEQSYGLHRDTRGTPRVQFANIRKMVLCQGLPHCLRLYFDPCIARHAKSLNSSLHA